jgi:Zinc finger, C3HC4 type (RING finger)
MTVNDHPLHCSICCDVSFNPVITPCQHVFCRVCIESGLRNAPCCPNDRRSLDRSSLRPISGLHEYIYNRTMVQCPKCEKWTGLLQQYKEHVPTCITSTYVQSLERKIQELKDQNESEKENMLRVIQSIQDEIMRQKQASAQDVEQTKQNHAAEKARLQNQINTAQNTISALESRMASMGPSFDGNYGYNQYNVADLTKIISRNLFDKPNSINPNRIFNCLKHCYDASLIDDDIQINVNMLLATSYASNWFSYNQQCRILEWFRNIRMSI